jgi:FG-GAP-like repeat/FG-GAP repeat
MRRVLHRRDAVAMAVAACALLSVPVVATPPVFPSPIYRTADYSYGIDAADINGDGLLDLAVGNCDWTVSILIAEGDGGYAAPVDYDIEDVCQAVALADFDADGDMDLAALGMTSTRLLWNNGEGTLELDQSPVWGFDALTALAVGDIGGDGDIDLVVSCYEGVVLTYINQGNGDFRADQVRIVGQYPKAVALGDLDGDGHLDIITANSSEDTVTILYGDIEDNYHYSDTLEVGTMPQDLGVGDLDGDGDGDILVGDTSARGCTLLRNEGGRLFRTEKTDCFEFGSSIVALGDFDGDGDLDAAGGGVGIAFNNGDGTFQPSIGYSVGGSVIQVLANDLDNDTHCDLAFCHLHDYGGASVLYNEGNGTFLTTPVNETYAPPDWMGSADLNGDGYADLVLGSSEENSLVLCWNEGDDSFQQEVKSLPEAVRFGALADINGNGGIDILLTTESTEEIIVLRGDGQGYIDEAIPLTELGDDHRLIATADLDGDGDADLLSLCIDSLRSFRNDGAGHFSEAGAWEVGDRPVDLAVADLNGDGVLDAAIANQDSDDLAVWFNQGDATFSHAATYALGKRSRGVSAGDVDGDQDIDLAVTADGLMLFLNDGNGALTLAGSYLASQDAASSLMADLNADGFADVFSQHGHNRIAVLFGAADGQLSEPAYFGVACATWLATATDFNLDGKIDLAVADKRDSLLAILPNILPDACLGDLDGDRDIDQNDLGILLAAYEVDDGGDIDGDGVTGQPDLGLLLANFGRVCD